MTATSTGLTNSTTEHRLRRRSGDVKLLQAQFTAYMADSAPGQVQPPDPATIVNVQSITQELAKVTAGGNDATDVLQLLTKTLNVIASL